MGPLPQSPEQHDQERRAFEAFRIILPADKFLVRQLSERDYGSYFLMELQIDRRSMSNMLLHVQAKSTARASLNKDGSQSHSFAISTINYLRNQPNSVVTLFVEDRETFLWAW